MTTELISTSRTASYKTTQYTTASHDLVQQELYSVLLITADNYLSPYQRFRNKFWKEYSKKLWDLFAIDSRPIRGEVLVRIRKNGLDAEPVWVNIFARGAHNRKASMYYFLDERVNETADMLIRSGRWEDSTESRTGITCLRLLKETHHAFTPMASMESFVGTLKRNA